MKTKPILTVILLLFVVGSVAYMITQERQAPEPSASPGLSQAPSGDPPAADATAPARQIFVYYFHGDVRCPTCHKLENYARQAVQSGFSEEMQSGLIVWKEVNVDRAENAHFIGDYQLVTKAVILSEVAEGREIRWKNLDQIWNLVGDQEAYIKYIQTHLQTFLEEASS